MATRMVQSIPNRIRQQIPLANTLPMALIRLTENEWIVLQTKMILCIKFVVTGIFNLRRSLQILFLQNQAQLEKE
jgi:hypothetical protein